jgi:methylated-DNA-[protein]-cysteine S-methyltransferase
MDETASRADRDRYRLFDTLIGDCGISWNERGITRLNLPERDRAATEKRLKGNCDGPHAPPPAIAQTIADLQRYLAGARIDFSSAVLDLPRAEEFERRVYEATRAVGWGETATYGELARRAGAPEMAREVGLAMARNPVPIIIPCHRVLAAGNRIGGFSAYGGILTKERLLALEGVYVTEPRLPGL